MGPLVRVSKPSLGKDGRWHAKAVLMVGDDAVLLHASAPRSFLRRAAAHAGDYISLEPYEAFDAMGCAGGCASSAIGADESAGVFDDIVKTVGTVANNPLVKAAANFIPYGPQIVGGVSAATGLYTGIKAQLPQAKQRLKKIKQDARAGKPQAKAAYRQLKTIAQADHLLAAVKRKSPGAARRLASIAQAASKDPQALEAIAALKGLQLAGGAVPPAPPPSFDLPVDAGPDYQEELAGVIARTVSRRQALAPQHRRVLDNLNSILRQAQARAARPRV